MEVNQVVSESAQSAVKSDDQPVNESVKVEETLDVNRPPEEYAKRLKEVTEESVKRKHKLRDSESRINDLQAQLEDLQKERLEEQGQYKDLYEREKQRKSDLEVKLKQEHAKNVWDRVTSQVRQVAANMNCVNPDDLVNLLTVEKELDGIDVDPKTYKVNESEIKDILERTKEKRSYLFGKPAPNVATGFSGTPKEEGLDTSKMSVKELANLAIESMKASK